MHVLAKALLEQNLIFHDLLAEIAHFAQKPFGQITKNGENYNAETETKFWSKFLTKPNCNFFGLTTDYDQPIHYRSFT